MPTQAAANYRMGTPLTQCGHCVWYNIGGQPFQFGRCTQVTGRISCYGLCDLYNRIRNPFPAVMTAEEMDALETWYWECAREKGINAPQSKAGDFQRYASGADTSLQSQFGAPANGRAQ
jgi:hypothetical protein